MATNKPKVTSQSKTATDLLNSLTSGIGTGSGATGKIDISSTQYDVSGLGLSLKITGGKTTLTADEFINALHRTAIEDSQTWAGIQQAMFVSNYYGSTLPNLGTWGTSDSASVKRFMEALTITNADPTAPTKVNKFLQDQENAAISLGGNGVRSKIQNITIPNTLDLNYIAKNALQKVLGSATKAQVDAFTKSFQSDVMAVARSNAVEPQIAPSKMLMSAPENARQADMPPPPQKTIMQNFADLQKAPTVQLRANQSAPDVNVAAEDFARKIDPNAAAVHGLSDAMGAWFNSLAKGNQ